MFEVNQSTFFKPSNRQYGFQDSYQVIATVKYWAREAMLNGIINEDGSLNEQETFENYNRYMIEMGCPQRITISDPLPHGIGRYCRQVTVLEPSPRSHYWRCDIEIISYLRHNGTASYYPLATLHEKRRRNLNHIGNWFHDEAFFAKMGLRQLPI